MKIKLNGDERQLGANELSVSDLLKEANVEMPDMVSVQVNGQFVDRENFVTAKVADGDTVDFLYFMGGGALR